MIQYAYDIPRITSLIYKQYTKHIEMSINQWRLKDSLGSSKIATENARVFHMHFLVEKHDSYSCYLRLVECIIKDTHSNDIPKNTIR